jgi:hypothetical protein
MRRPYLSQLLLAGSLLLASSVAQAFETVDTLIWPSDGRFPAYPPEAVHPYALFVEAGAMYDSNILRRDGTPEDENIFRFGVGGRADQLVAGRQRVRLEARGDQYVYDKFSDLGHFAYAGAATWLWELGNDFAGTLGYARAYRLAALAEVQRPIKRMVTTDDFVGTGAWRLGPHARLRGGVSYGRGKRETPGEEEVVLGTRSATVGADWVTNLGNAIGIEHRQSRGDAPVSTSIDPNATFGSNDYKERETSLVAAYISGVTLRFTGRVGRTTRTYTDLPNNFTGTTYRGGVEWLPGYKTIIAFEAYKEPRAIIDIAASHVLTRGFAFGPSWAPTAHIVTSLRFVDENRRFISADPSVAPVGTLLDEDVRLIRLGIGWEPQRLLQVGLGLDRGNRDSNTTGRNYNFTAAMANIRVIW